ncbi:MAG TPA: thioesterase domain-containing protein, partial [Thermoanaerobaculia bacterium]|nr:thioesterase domain-containing protein [Thermoanaerobaculia bacterium]
VVDPDLRPQPIGVPGELHVGGAGLAQGYLGRPELTAERFVPDPFAGAPGARLYRSGDLARRLPDGDLEYLGRIDHQVKIRGFRIELGEIEAALASHPGVREAVVLAREDRLAAYVVPTPGESLDPAGLRAYLAARLPEPMLPSAFVFLDALPLTVNGKVDRRALPAPEAGAVAARSRVAPRTPLERFLAGQLRAVLGLGEEREVSIEDDFFALGGTSISGAIFVHRLQEALGEIVHVVTIFDHPTVAALAAYVRAEHPVAARRLWGEGQAAGEVVSIVGPEEIAQMRQLIAAGREPSLEPAETPGPPVLFVLSPPRSGSTLLRVMLGAHPQLFAPPELELLSFHTMIERHAAFQGRERYWLEGLVRAVMEARQMEAVEAERIVAEAERQGWTTRRFYRELASWLPGSPRQILVDKTPSYALDPEILARAEAGFDSARYLHLVRHPQATNRSFEEAKMEQIVFRRPHPFSRRQLAELVWTVSHRNILDFLERVPAERRHTVHFEALVREPDRVLAAVCDFLGIEYRPEMAEPYGPGVARMVDGPHAVSRMLGDVKFLGHGRVDPAAAERWRQAGEAPLGEPARELAVELGYEDFAKPGRGVLVPLQAGTPPHRPLFCVHPVGGEVVAYRELAERLGPHQPVYGLQSPEPPVADLRAMAALYLEALRAVQPAGPYRLAGWSMGGVVVYEMARQLAERGERVELLALLDTLSPVVWAAEPPLSDVDLVAAFALDLARLSGVAVPAVDLSGLDADGALALVLKLGREAGVLAPGVEPAELRRLFDRFRANRRALTAYPPLPYGGTVTLFRATARPGGPEGIEEGPDLGWNGLVGELRVSELPGDHYSILHGPGAAALAAALTRLAGGGERLSMR